MIKIVTDAEANLTPELMEQYDIRTMPLWIHFGEGAYQEGRNITREEFYDRLIDTDEFPKTSQASVGQFLELYRPLVEAGHEILSIHISSELSGTYQSAVGAAQQLPDAKISVFDSRYAATFQSLMVWRAAEWAAQGLSREEIVARLEGMIPNLHNFFLVDTLEYLRRGGRIGGAAALLGTLLQVKPILTLKDGLIEVYDKTRTRKRALAQLKQLALGAADGAKSVDLAVLHVRCPQVAHMLADKLAAELAPQRILVDLIGPGIGAHVGPGAIGVGIYVEPVTDEEQRDA